MIVSKNQSNNPQEQPVVTEEVIEYTPNALCEVFNAVKEILGELPENPDDPGSRPFFKTIALNTGQLRRIKNSKQNQESGIAFPAIFIHFINVRYLVQQARVGEGRATMRIQYVLNRLNNDDPRYELEGYDLFQRINVAIQDGKNVYPALNERFNLTYFDQPETFENGLQQYWIDYEVWFTEYSAYRYRNYVDCYLVAPPFTDHSDQKPENNQEGHDDHKSPTYDEATHLSEP